MNSRVVKCLYVILFIAIGVLSCTNESEDRSLTVDEYIKSGLPDPRKKWNITDYSEARNVLTKMKWLKPFDLPVKGSEKSGAVFDHMLSYDYLSFLKDSTILLNEKAGRISEFRRVSDFWMDVYSNPTIPVDYYQRERLHIRMFNLKVAEAMLNVAREINRSDDPADIALQYGYQGIKRNYLASLDSTLKAHHAPKFPGGDLDTIADSIFNSVMRNKKWMDTSEVRELKQSLNLVIERTSSEYVREKYRTLERSIN